MGIVLDILLAAIAVICIVYGYKKGFFKTVISLMSGICAFLCTYTFTPVLSEFLKEKLIVGRVKDSLFATFSSIAKVGKEGAEEAVYDLSRLLSNPQFADTVKHCGADEKEIALLVSGGGAEAGEILDTVAYKVAEPISAAFAGALAFILLFALSFVLIRLLVFCIGILFRLPVLKNIDKTLGLIFGVLSAVFFVWVFSLSAVSLVTALSGIAPGSFSAQIIERSLLVEFFAKFNPFSGLVSNIL